MQHGTLTDALTTEKVVCKIAKGNKKTTQVYHIARSFNIVQKIEGMKRYPLIFETDKDIYLLWATSAEWYCKNYDRVHVKRLSPLDYAEHLEGILEKNERVV